MFHASSGYQTTQYEKCLRPIDMDRRQRQHHNRSVADRLRTNTGPLCLHITLWMTMVVFGLIYCFLVYYVLLKGNPQVGGVLLTASSTNYLVSVLSQVFTMLTDMTVKNHLDALRWALAARSKGVSGISFFQLSGATDLLYIMLLTVACRFRNWWGILRLALPIAGLYLGSILKFDADFIFYFIPQPETIPVYAGLIAPDLRLLGHLPVSYLCVFFIGWIPTLTSFPKFSASMPMKGCGENCTSYFLPGGLEVVRQLSPYLNVTIFENNLFATTKDVRIYNAPGFLLRYERLADDFYFDLQEECLYYGEEIDDGLQLCVSDRNGSIAVGWQACPTELRLAKQCMNDTSWHSRPMKTKTLFSTYRQYATTVYSWEYQKIQNVETTTEPLFQNLTRNTYISIWNALFIVPEKVNYLDPNGGTQVKALLWSLTWLIRLYVEDFPDDPYTPLSHLHNFLAIPMQFTTVCVEYVNFTFPFLEARLPDELLTYVQRGSASDRLVSQPWTVWAFIGSTVFAIALVGFTLFWILLLPYPMPKSSGLPEIDMLEIVGNGPDRIVAARNSEDCGSIFMRLSVYVQSKGFTSLSPWRMARGITKTRMKLVDEQVHKPRGAKPTERIQDETLLAYLRVGDDEIY